MSTRPTPALQEYQKLIGLRFGAIFAACIALMWTGVFSSFTGGKSRTGLAIVLSTLSASCLLFGICLSIRTRPRHKQSLPYFKSGAFWAKFYGVIASEFLAVFLAIHLLQAHNVHNVTFPIIILVVGLHFYPLAYWNGNTLWYATATILTVATVLLMALVNNNATTTLFGAPHSSTWSLISAGTMVLVMLITSCMSSLMYLHKVRR